MKLLIASYEKSRALSLIKIIKHYFVIFIMLSQNVQYLQICRTYQLITTKCLEPKVDKN